MLGRLSLALPKAHMSDAEAKARVDLYWRALSRHALVDLREAFDVILRTCRFFPTIMQIEEAIAPIRARRMARVNRATMLILKHEREWRPPLESLIDASELGKIMRLGVGSLANQTTAQGGSHG